MEAKDWSEVNHMLFFLFRTPHLSTRRSDRARVYSDSGERGKEVASGGRDKQPKPNTKPNHMSFFLYPLSDRSSRIARTP